MATTARPLVTFIPASKVHLQIHGISLTHHVPTQVRYLCNLQATKNYLQHRYSWTSQTFDSVDWELFRSSFLALSFNLRLFTIKWVNHLLPLGYRQHRINVHHSPNCPSCDHSHEDDDHILHCPNLARQALLRDTLARLLLLFNKWHADPALRMMLRHAFNLLLDPTYHDVFPDSLPNAYHVLFATQQRIGWDHLFYGHFAPAWTTLQHSYLGFVKKPRKHQQASSLMKAIHSELFSTVHSLWLQRNEHLHGTLPTQLHSIKRLHLLAQISDLYDSAPCMLSTDRRLFELPLRDRQKHSTSSLRNFILLAAPLVKRSIRDADQLGSHSQPITSYFGPRFPPPPELWDVIHPLVDHITLEADLEWEPWEPD